MHAPAMPPQPKFWQDVGSVAWSLPVVQHTFADPRPAMSEAQLVAAHGCACHQDEERHTLDEWDVIEARQRAFAADPEAVEAEARDIERVQKAGAA